MHNMIYIRKTAILQMLSYSRSRGSRSKRENAKNSKMGLYAHNVVPIRLVFLTECRAPPNLLIRNMMRKWLTQNKIKELVNS